MALKNTDVTIRLSGGASNTNPANSFGGVKSSTSAGSNLFAGADETKCKDGAVECVTLYVSNDSTTDAAENVVVWITANTPSPTTTLDVALGAAGLNGTETTRAGLTATPIGVTFSAAASKAAGLALGTIPAGQHRAFHVRRTIQAGTALLASDTWELAAEAETVQ